MRSHCAASSERWVATSIESSFGNGVMVHGLVIGTHWKTRLSDPNPETRVKARLDGVERQMAILVLKKDGCVYDLVLDVSPARFPQAVPAFESMRDGFDVYTREGS